MVTTRGGGVTGPGLVARIKSKVPGTREHRALKGTGGVKKHIPGTAEHNVTHPTAGAGVGPTTGTTTGNVGTKVASAIPGTTEHKATHPRPRGRGGIVAKIKKAIPGTVEHKATHPRAAGTGVATGPGI